MAQRTFRLSGRIYLGTKVCITVLVLVKLRPVLR